MNNEQTPIENSKKELETKLSVLQQKITQEKIPIIIIFEGFSASGKGGAISSLILNFDPRGFTVYSTRKPTKEEQRLPWLERFAEKIPAKGRIAIFDRSWYSGVMRQYFKENMAEAISRLEDINMFERQLNDDGYIIIKFFLDISKKEQKKRLKKLLESEDTSWRVQKRDLKNLKNYEEINDFYKNMLKRTDRPNAKWHFIDAKDKKEVRQKVLETVAETLEAAIAQKQNPPQPAVPEKPFINVDFKLLPAPKISTLDLTQPLEREEYKVKLKALQKELKDLHNVIYRHKVPVIITFEGNDAAGKGGSIKRLAAALDPRGYSVIPVGAPTPDEISRHYLWRFYRNLPKDGHIAIFDRTWYGRVLVERIEGFTPQYRVMQAYNEINEFEEMLHNWGALILKFWMAIDKDEQLRRFEDRQNTPEKQWKITEEDWRNREKWDIYETCVDEMIKYTNTDFAPWHIIESNNKLAARVKVLTIVIDAIKKKLGIEDKEDEEE